MDTMSHVTRPEPVTRTQVTICRDVRISLENATAIRPASIAFATGNRYVVADGSSLRMCHNLHNTRNLDLKAPQNNPNNHREAWIQNFTNVNRGLEQLRQA